MSLLLMGLKQLFHLLPIWDEDLNKCTVYYHCFTVRLMHAVLEAVKENFSVFRSVCDFVKGQVILRAETPRKVYVAEGEI